MLDEFQRVLDPSSAKPLEPLASALRKIAQRVPDKGCFWLVLNRLVDPGWTEPFYPALLEPPICLEDLQRIVLQGISMGDAEERFPADRRMEVVRRLGANPRVLRLLGHLLRHYPLEELLGSPGDVPEAPVEPRLTEGIERDLLAKANAGLSNPASVLLRDLSILRDPARWELVEVMGSHLGNVRALSRELRERYLLETVPNKGYRVHPIVREVEGPRLRREGEAWRAAHGRAGTWYARPLHAADRSHADDAKLALGLAGARYHLVEAQAERADGNERRIVEAALHAAAAEPSIYLLQRVRDWAGTGEPENAQDTLDHFPRRLQYGSRQGSAWLAALVALHQGKLPRASEFLAAYLDASAPTTEAGIRASLLSEWDHRIATVGEANPALTCPILPPSVTVSEKIFSGHSMARQCCPSIRPSPASPQRVKTAGCASSL